VGIAAIKEKVTKPLQGLKVAAYYGCLITRPHAITEFEDPEQPVIMDKMLETLGAETVKWSHKTECCGGGFAVSDTDIVIDMGGQVLEAARQAQADAIVTACPMCQTNLDTRQHLISRDRKINYNMPVIYLTQLMGLAFGYSFRQMGLGTLMVSPVQLLRSKSII
jgi:heterodisulfide reductase subunit B